MVVVELLFWKTNTECYEMVEGYGSLNVKRLALSYLFSFIQYLRAFFHLILRLDRWASPEKLFILATRMTKELTFSM